MNIADGVKPLSGGQRGGRECGHTTDFIGENQGCIGGLGRLGESTLGGEECILTFPMPLIRFFVVHGFTQEEIKMKILCFVVGVTENEAMQCREAVLAAPEGLRVFVYGDYAAAVSKLEDGFDIVAASGDQRNIALGFADAAARIAKTGSQTTLAQLGFVALCSVARKGGTRGEDARKIILSCLGPDAYVRGNYPIDSASRVVVTRGVVADVQQYAQYYLKDRKLFPTVISASGYGLSGIVRAVVRHASKNRPSRGGGEEQPRALYFQNKRLALA